MTITSPQFIWLGDQPIDHQAMFVSIHGKPARRTDEGENRWILARGVVDVSPNAGEVEINITVDGQYRLWLDGVRLGQGPVRSNPAYQRTDCYRLGAEFVVGRHVIAVLIHVPGRDLAWYETVKGAWQPSFGDGGLMLRATRAEQPETLLFEADVNWRIVESSAWKRDTPVAGWGQDFLEDVDGRQLDPLWIHPDFDDGDWPYAQVMEATPSAEVAARGWMTARPFPVLVKSETAQLEEEQVWPAHFLWAKSAIPRPDLPVKQRLFDEEITDLADGSCVTGAASLCLPGGAAHIRTDENSDTVLMYEFHPYRVGYPFMEIDAQGGEIIEVAVAESLPGEFGKGLTGDGLRSDERMWVAHVFRYICRPGRQRFEKFVATGVRALQLVVRDAPVGVIVHELGLIATGQPFKPEGNFACSDPVLTRLWNVGAHTVQMCAQDGWVDCPGRESRQWLGDGVVMFDMAARAFGPSSWPLQRQFLVQVAEGQRADGLARMVSPGDIPTTAITIPDYTLLWIIGVDRYFETSLDLPLIERLMPEIERSLGWFERMAQGGILVRDIPEWHFIEWADVDRRGWSMPFNALYCGALQSAARLAEFSQRPRLALRWKARAAAVAEELNRRHWDPSKTLYVDSVDPETGQQAARVSQHGNALALLFGIAPDERRAAILKAITDSSRLNLTNAPPIMVDAGPFDEVQQIVRANSFFGHFVYDAIAEAGGVDWVLEELANGYGPMLDAGATTLWESFTPVASLCHGFSATPVYQLSKHVLGITPLADGYTRFTARPAGRKIDWATGVVPTGHGLITIEWIREAGYICATLAYPALLEFAPPSTAINLVTDEETDGRRVAKFKLSA